MLCEICNEREHHHKHHIQSKVYNGSNKAYNTCMLCASDHVEVHKGTLIIEGRFLTDDGYMLIWHRNGDDSITGTDPSPVYLISPPAPRYLA